LVLYALYRRALPQPLAGIPYNREAAASILGDLPTLWKLQRSRDLRALFSDLTTRRHNSPIVQIFGLGFRGASRPTLIVSDFATAQEILLRRGRDFDRPESQVEALRGVLPHHHIAMQTSDPQFRKNRELVKDLMTPAFLHTVNVPEIWRNTVLFVHLWRAKARIAGTEGRAFEAAEDVSRMTFDIIKNVAIGRDENTMIGFNGSAVDNDNDSDDDDDDDDKNKAYVFPAPPHDETLEAQTRMNEAITPGIPVPPRWYHAVNNCTRRMREAYASKERVLKRQVSLAVRRMEAGEPLESALDYMIRREMGAAKKADRDPVFDSVYMYDELYGYLGAGHDTTATTFQWGLKHLSQHQHAQQKAREDLCSVYREAYAQKRQPAAAEIVKRTSPWIEAIIEEILRLSGPVSASARKTTVDTTILGHAVPKGTTVLMAMQGPGINAPSHQQGGDRSDKKAHSFTKRTTWDDLEPEAFVPERWLARDDEGHLVYDAQAGPMLSFGLGIRGCFGKRLAYLTLRVLFTLLLWNFELQSVPEELDSWKAIQILTRKPVQCYVRLR
ncbi:cytochrome P450, partial [Coniella lustricola]